MNKEDKSEYFSQVISLFNQSTNHEQANEIFKQLTRISTFFTSKKELEDFKNYLIIMESQNKLNFSSENSEWADIQTPPALVKTVLALLASTGIQPGVIIEPTFGDGNFILQASEYFPNISLIYGVEIQKERKWNYGIKSLLLRYLEKPIQELEISVHTDNIFTHDFSQLVSSLENTPILIVGNPPWITNADLGALNSNNLPKKSNLRKLQGLEALTGKSNFDIAETIIKKMIQQFANINGTLAFLCKNTVIKNITKELQKSESNIGNLKAYQFDAVKEFGKSCNASLFVCDLNVDRAENQCSVYDLDNPEKLKRRFGWINNKFVSNIEKYRAVTEFDGQSHFNWRQGVKHDCSKVLELTQDKRGVLVNKNGAIVEIEDERIFPLLKGSMIRDFEIQTSTKKIILPQRKLNEDITIIEKDYPKTWLYLNSNLKHFSKRKSSIYRKKNPFSIFGIGEYSFKPYKVAIAGMYKKPIFSLVTPINSKPVMFDDTCYYLSFSTLNEALFVCTALNSEKTLDLLDAIVFQDSKRPYTKEMLMRINVDLILQSLSFDDILSIWKKHNFSKINNYSAKDFEMVKRL